MITLKQLQAVSRSLNETGFLWGCRKAAFESLRKAHGYDTGYPLSLLRPESGDEDCSAAYTYADGVIADTFASFATGGLDAKERKIFERAYASLAQPSDSLETARHCAFRTFGMYVRVPPNTCLTVPIELQFRNVGQWAATHIVLVVGAGSQVTFVERLNNDMGGEDREPSGDSTGLWSHIAEVIVEDDAQVEYVSLQLADSGSGVCIRHCSSVGAGASISWRNATIGGATVTHDLCSQLRGDHAASSVDWIAYAKGKESQRLSACNVFTARDGRGEITMKGVAENKAHVACNGMIDIGLDGRGTDAYLTQDVLMLDPTARVDAIPGLEIKTNDVKASHSATVSRVTDEDLFYFGARGIPPATARRMYIEGFLSDMTERISDAGIRQDALSRVNAKYDAAPSLHGRR